MEPQFELADTILDNVHKPRSCSNYSDVLRSSQKLRIVWEPWNPLDMHHVMAFASLYIGDSQTMAAEAGVLGVFFVRFNDFVGRIGYLRELEDIYHLGFGIHATPLPNSNPQLVPQLNNSTSNNALGEQPFGPEAMYEIVEQLVAMDPDERRTTFQQRRQKMLSDKIDCAKFLTWFIENYPKSVAETKNATLDFWERFK